MRMQTQQYHWRGWGCLGTFFLVLTGSIADAIEPQAANPTNQYTFLQIRMGIPVRITLYAPDQATANLASDAAFARFRDLDRVMSDYDPDSELMQLCNSYQLKKPMKVSDDLFAVLSAAQSLSRQTDGAFDVTVGPVVKLWRIARRRKRLPDEQRLKTALKKVGYQSLRLDLIENTVTFLKPDMQLDLGGIAKGFAADAALAELKKHGVTRVLIDAGGDLVAGDPPPDRDYWRIDVEKLGSKDNHKGPASPLKLRNCAVATSGDAYQYLEIDGTRYSHLVDPKTGIGITTPSTVTVIASTGIQADSLASAISVMNDPQAIQSLADNADAEFLKVQRSVDCIIEEVSTGFSDYWINDSEVNNE